MASTAAGPIRAIGGPRDPQGYQQITDLSSAIGLTVPSNAFYAFIICEGTNSMARWRDDGVDPDASTGMPLWSGTSLEYAGKLSAIKFIDGSGTSTLNVSYYR